MNRMQPLLTRQAVRAIGNLRGSADDALRAIRGLPLLLRRHGLLATLAHHHNSGDATRQKVACAFVDALASVTPFGTSVPAKRIRELASEPLTVYLLHSQVAMAQADAWVRVAEALLAPAGAAPVDGNERRSEHAEA